ncbi:MAG: glycosyltransferase family 1 protein [Bacteroidales bacterium]|nr:glycosyltransferase family 1 protein [Bacteroidales bacterium]
MDKHLHIVSFNVPLPADYGGIIDVFYRLKSLSAMGVKIHLHCFAYGRPPASELEHYCTEVHYYARRMSPLLMLGRRPYIVSSRDSAELRRRLAADDHPILLEGLHCCALLQYPEFSHRHIMVRAHNVESDYYALLAQAETSPLRKVYLRWEAGKIRRFEPVLSHAQWVFAVSDADIQAFSAMGCSNLSVLTSSHPFDSVASHCGRGDYVLYHGNLAVAENYRAVEFLADNLFSCCNHTFVVAGNEPPQWLCAKLRRHANVRLVASPDDAAMRRLVADAHVNLLYTAQPTGLKLKLLNSLFSGRHCLVNSAMVAGTALGQLCTVADSTGAMASALDRLMAADFDAAALDRRRHLLEPLIPANANRAIFDQI